LEVIRNVHLKAVAVVASNLKGWLCVPLETIYDAVEMIKDWDRFITNVFF
jgi:hypothetical protein